ncbi:MAG: LapA family protein [Chloroflexota bacterium]|jgi:uncharacterized integral membrane protein
MGILLVAVIILFAVTLFSVQNARAVDVSFFFWSFQASLAMVIFLSVVAGAIVGAIVSTYAGMKMKKKRVG